MARRSDRTWITVAIALLSALVMLGGTAVAATGGSFLLGKSNKAGTTTTLTNTGKGAALTLKTAKKTTPPLSVSGNKTKIAALNADFIDGLTSSQFQRRVTGKCGTATSIVAILANGTVSCGNNTSGLQIRVAGVCSGSSALQSVAVDGTVTCVDASTGLQKRVTGVCTGALALQSVGVDGTVTCVDATTGLQKRVTGTCSGNQAVQSVTSDGAVTCSSDALWAVVNGNGTKARSRSVASVTKSQSASGLYTVTFDRDVSQCAYLATIGAASATTPPFGWIAVSPASGDATSVVVSTADPSNAQVGHDEPFMLHVVC